MPKGAPEILTGARGPRGPENTTVVSDIAESLPQVADIQLQDEQVHFVSKWREYSVVIATEPDRVNSQGEIVRGLNKAVRFHDFNLITEDPVVIRKLRKLKEYGLGREVWEKPDQDRMLAQRAIEMAELAIDGLPPEMQSALVAKLQAKLKTFQLPDVNTVDQES